MIAVCVHLLPTQCRESHACTLSRCFLFVSARCEFLCRVKNPEKVAKGARPQFCLPRKCLRPSLRHEMFFNDDEASRDSAEEFCRLKHRVAQPWTRIFIPAYCFAIP